MHSRSPRPDHVNAFVPKLLILDDDPVMREILAILAERQGFEARMVSNPDDFYDELQAWKPSHITIDLVMPRKDGIEVLRDLALKQCAAAIMIISGMEPRVLQSARRVAIERGLNITGVLSKPFRHEALHQLLAESAPREPWKNKRRYAGGLLVSPEVIGEALDEDQFVLHYQPKIDLRTGRLLGVEALVRWQHPLLGLVMPDEFIPEIERVGAIAKLTRRVFERGIEWFSEYAVGDETTLAINISALDLASLSLADQLTDLCQSRGIAPERVIIELTETSAMKYPDVALATLTRLRIKGFGLAIDDFGTGYSSMIQLARMPFSSMKIDRSFVASMEENMESEKIVSSIISLGHALDMQIVAEGVENLRCARVLKDLGCESAQGYGIGKPMAAKEFASWRQAWVGKAFVDGLEHCEQSPNVGGTR